MGNTIVNLSQLSSLAKFSTEYSNLGDDYIFTRINNNVELPASTGPLRLDGISWFLCLEGTVEFTVNLDHVTIGPNCLVITQPDSIIELNSIHKGKFDCYMLFVSRDFMRDLNLDVNVLSTMPRRRKLKENKPLIEITSDDAKLLCTYFDLIHHNTVANSEDLYVRSISRNIIAALCYQLIQMARNKFKDLVPEHSEKPRSRKVGYVEDFVTLLHRHHREHRAVAFYAEKLFISPKYLSLIIKEATGQSAAELIDEFVILEAKNLLRYSGKNIQQVAYELNFPNQSSFGKYFKHLTGMSPSEYQRS